MKPEYEIFRLNSPLEPQNKVNPSYKQFESLLDLASYKLLEEGKERLTDNDGLITVCASLNGIPAGIAVSSFNKILETSRILVFSLFGNLRDEKPGIGLMMNLLEALKKCGSRNCEFIYLKEESKAAYLEEILRKTTFSPSKLFMLRYIFSADAFSPDWLYKNYSYPEGMQEFFWVDLSDADRKIVKAKAAQKHFRPAVSPFQNEQSLEPINSLGVKKDGDIVAWILTHQKDDNTLQYSAFYVDKSLRDKQLTIKLLSRAIILHITKSGRRHAIVEIPLKLVSYHWIRFAKKRLEPYAIKLEHLFQVSREL